MVCIVARAKKCAILVFHYILFSSKDIDAGFGHVIQRHPIYAYQKKFNCERYKTKEIIYKNLFFQKSLILFSSFLIYICAELKSIKKYILY